MACGAWFWMHSRSHFLFCYIRTVYIPRWNLGVCLGHEVYSPSIVFCRFGMPIMWVKAQLYPRLKKHCSGGNQKYRIQIAQFLKTRDKSQVPALAYVTYLNSPVRRNASLHSTLCGNMWTSRILGNCLMCQHRSETGPQFWSSCDWTPKCPLALQDATRYESHHAHDRMLSTSINMWGKLE